MNKLYLSGLVLILAFATSQAQAQKENAIQLFQKLQYTADVNYKDGYFSSAYKTYHLLAEYNDKFSQYKLATMYAEGKAVQPSKAYAYAWSKLSAEDGTRILVEQHNAYARSLSKSDIQAGEAVYLELQKKYGTYALLVKADKLVKEIRRKCTGSRVGATCDGVVDLASKCSIPNSTSYSNICLTLGAVGIPSVSGLHPKQLEEFHAKVDQLTKKYEPGIVELREISTYN